ncbi:MAG: ThuA domain-containing protein [Bacteroidota bacterium]|nr:ThuA domain-containing protein [Bacteroidota bacterium]|tara:strand:- start:375 stop:1124 length:750 start_codon:yes stop_codon:yes gene_type:complete
MISKLSLILLLTLIDFSQKKEFIKTTNSAKANKFSVLILTETQGFVHHNAIREGAKLITRLGLENNFNVTLTNSSKFISKKELKTTDAIVFLCTTLDVLNSEEQKLFKEFINKGGGYVGIHSAADTEYEWEWYGKLVGGYFKNHPKIQKARIITKNNKHIATTHLDESWEITDEWYNYKDINPNVNVLLNLDESSYKGGENGTNHPITWFHEFDGGRSFYTGLGHRGEVYKDDRFIKILLGGILYVTQN